MRSLLVFTYLSVNLFVSAQNIPEGYLLQYQQNFSGSKALSDFEMSNPDKWGIFKAASNFYLQCSSADSLTEFPSNLGIINNRIFGDFILETDVLPLKDSLGMAEVCLFLGYRDPSKYYYVQLANLSDSITNGIFLVKNNFRKRLTGEEEKTVVWKEGKWHKVRLERDIVRRTIKIYVDNFDVPLTMVKDYELVMGSVGFGSASGSARFDNIKIWAPTVLSEEELRGME